MNAPVLVARGLACGYALRPDVLRGVDFAAAPGAFVCLLGRNGSGKTTLLRALLGLLTPRAGAVELDGRPLEAVPLRARARRLAYVPQAPSATFAFTVEEIVAFGRLAHQGALGLAGEQDRAIVREALRMTGAEGLESRTLDELSGGEAQCVMIARALAQQPGVLLLDEPASHLDLRNQLRVFAMLRRIAHDWPMAVVCVSHDVNLAARYADRLALLADGRLLADGPPDAILRADLLRAAYDIDVDLLPRPGEPLPVVWPREKSARGNVGAPALR